MVAGGTQFFFLALPFRNLSGLAERLQRLPDLDADGYPAFLQEVRKRTRPGDSIAIFFPVRDWNEGYAYAYYRASYFLTGRRVVPLVAPDNRLLLQSLRDATYVAAWGKRLPDAHHAHAPVWEGSGGVLYRSVR